MDFEEFVAEVEKAFPDDVTKRYKILLAAYADPKVMDRLREYLLLQTLPDIGTPFSVPQASEIQGPFLIGHTRRGDDVGLQEGAIGEHVYIAGATGVGKTSLMLGLTQQLTEAGYTFTAFDVKRDYAALIKVAPDVYVWRCYQGEPKFNPTFPFTKKEIWLPTIAHILAQAETLLEGSENYVYEAICALDETFGEEPFSLVDLRDYLLFQATRKHSTRERQYLDTTLNRLKSLCTGMPAFDCAEGYPIERRNEVIELPFNPQHRRMFIQAYMAAHILPKIVSGERSSLRHVFIFDECKNIAPRAAERNPAQGVPVMTELVSFAREFGYGIITADQEPKLVSATLLSNCHVRIMMRQSSGEDLATMVNSIGLLDHEQRQYAHSLQRQQAILKIGGSDPFPITIRDFSIARDKNVDPKDLEERMQRLPELPFAPRSDRMRTWLAGEKEKTKGLSAEEERFLSSLFDRPTLGVTERYAHLGLTRYRGNRIKDRLIKEGFLKPLEVYPGRGGTITLLQPLEKTYTHLKSKGRKVKLRGRGNVPHLFWTEQAARAMERQFPTCPVEQEAKVGDHWIDVLVRSDILLGIEIVMSPEISQLESIGKALKEVGRLIVACDPDALDAIKEKASKAFPEDIPRMEFVPVQNYYEPKGSS